MTLTREPRLPLRDDPMRDGDFEHRTVKTVSMFHNIKEPEERGVEGDSARRADHQRQEKLK